ncbi:single-stranded DNA-binding protein [Microbacterium sp. NPDC090014]|uniref:single-stranded DNA-binding protein n=1 Tax=Microbacterium sp. NPDC090014 TaxID=3364205 RepID=UPI003811ED75
MADIESPFLIRTYDRPPTLRGWHDAAASAVLLHMRTSILVVQDLVFRVRRKHRRSALCSEPDARSGHRGANMYDTVTIVGNVATDPTQGRTTSGIPVTNFRLASTHRRFDESTRTWIDVVTNWYSVAAFRQLGEHAKASLRAGDSVIVTGRMKIRAWENNGKQGTSVDIDADVVGRERRRACGIRQRPRGFVPLRFRCVLRAGEDCVRRTRSW